MAESLAERRERYEVAVRDLRVVADDLLAKGMDEESVARVVVVMRNQLKKAVRADDPPILVRYFETRNFRLYADALGPTADAQLKKYGNWTAVIEAACRPARISR